MFKKRIYAILCIFLLLLPKRTDPMALTTKIIIYGVTATVVVVAVAWKTIKKYWDLLYYMREIEKKVENVDSNVTGVKKDVETVGQNVKKVEKDVGEVRIGVENVQKGVDGVKICVDRVENGVSEAKVGINQAKMETLEAKKALLQELLSFKKNIVEKIDDLKDYVTSVDDNLDKLGEKITSDIKKSECEQKFFIKGLLDDMEVKLRGILEDKSEKVENIERRFRAILDEKIERVRVSIVEACESCINSGMRKIISKEV